MSEKLNCKTEKDDQHEDGCYVPVRYVIVILLFFGTCVSYTIRTDTSLAIVAMINKTALRELENDCSIPTDPWCDNTTIPQQLDDSLCPVKLTGQNDSSIPDYDEGSFLWKSEKQGIILGAFFYGYAITQIPGGRLGDKFGPKWLIGGGVMLGSIFTALVPLVAELGVAPLVVLRVLTGMSQGCLYPGIAAILNRWAPDRERSRLYSLCNAGASIGVVICMPLVGYLCRQTGLGGWRSVFYTFGGTGFVWAVLWMLLSTNEPSMHPRISNEERKYIEENLTISRKSSQAMSVPWKSIVTSIPVWAHVFAWCTSAFLLYIRLTELPNYLDQVLHFPIQQNGIFNALVNLAPPITSILGGIVADSLITSRKMSKTNVRKMLECLGLLGSSACLIGVTLSGCNRVMVITLLTLSSGMQGICSVADGVLAMDMAPSFSGTLFGFGNTFGAATGFICPMIVGFILGLDGITLTDQWHYVFYLTTGLCVLSSVIVLTLWTAEVQPWDPSFRNEVDELSCQSTCGCDADNLTLTDHAHKC